MRPGVAHGAGPLETAIYVENHFVNNDANFARVRASGAATVRLSLDWASVASTRRPSRPEARDPGRYNFAGFDGLVRAAVRAGLKPIVTIWNAPAWAQQRKGRPNGNWFVEPAAYGDFATAAARRYSGEFEDLPRVRYWMAWNEPNLVFYLNPQFTGGAPSSPALYRILLNAFADAVHGVKPGNLVVAGGLAPFTQLDVKNRGVGPLTFMRSLLCVSRKLTPTCSARARFDVWSHHPYTSGGPTHTAYRADDVSLGDLPEMKAVLDAAYRLRRIQSRRRPLFWVTEFSWESKPPDPRGVPTALHTRWVSEGLYRMWKAGVTLVTWFRLTDEPYPKSPYQSGLYYRDADGDAGRAKPALLAFRFPFVAFREKGGAVLVWGRTPSSRALSVLVEQYDGFGWRRVAVLRANRYGIFTKRLPLAGRGPLRAVQLPGGGERREVSRGFSLTVPPDRVVRPFG